MTRPDISVMVISHNHAPFIEIAMRSIDAQVTDFSVEIIVADDASTDGTRELLLAWAAENDRPVRVLEAQERLGITRNYARAFAACRGRMIAVLEGDDEWISPEKLQLQAEALERSSDIVLVANRFVLHSDDRGEGVVHPVIGLDAFETRISSARIADENWFGTFSACMFRADAVERISPEVFEETAYDWLIAMAITEHGDALLLPQVMTLYRVHSGGTWSARTAIERATILRDLIPRYMTVLQGRLNRPLSRALARAEAQLRAAARNGSLDDRPSPPPPAPLGRRPISTPRIASTRRPRVSVVMTSFNHADYVIEAAESVLDQSMADLELVIVDDASTDSSLDVLASITDPRVRTYVLGSNEGGAAALNFAIQQTRGDLVAIINSDDIWERTKLERQLGVLDRRPELGAVFTAARFVAEDGGPLAPKRIPPWSEIFHQPNRSQGQWLRFFLENGNALCHPSVLLKRSVYETIGLYDNSLRQLPDLDRWVALVKRYPIAVLGDEPLVRFRTFRQPTNASGHSSENIVRTYHEHLVVNERFFDGVSDEILAEGFGDVLRATDLEDPDVRACAVALLWLDCPGPLAELNRAEALSALRAVLRTEGGKLVLRTHFGITDRDLHALATSGEGARTLDALHALRQLSVTPELPALGAAPKASVPRRAVRLLRRTPMHRWPAAVADVLRRRGRS